MHNHLIYLKKMHIDKIDLFGIELHSHAHTTFSSNRIIENPTLFIRYQPHPINFC